MENLPTECLDLFDDFELERDSERRLATYALEDYYGAILSEMGENYLGFTNNDIEQGIGTQWNKAKSRFQSVGITRIPDKYNNCIHLLADSRNSVAHDYFHVSGRERLEQARELAEEWARWFIEKSKEYKGKEENLTFEENMNKMRLEALISAIKNPDQYDYPDLQDRQEEINEKAEMNIMYEPVAPFEIEKIDDYNYEIYYRADWEDLHINDDEVSIISLDSFADAIELRSEAKSIKNENSRRKRRQVAYLEREAQQKNQKTVPCIIINPYKEDSREVQLNIKYPSGKEERLWQDTRELPKQARDILKNKSEGEIITAILGTDRQGDIYIRDIV